MDDCGDQIERRQWEVKMQSFRLCLSEVLRTYELIQSYAFDEVISREESHEIFALLNTQQDIKAADMFLKAFLGSKSTQKWKVLETELSRTEHEMAYEFLCHGCTDYLVNHDLWVKIVNSLRKQVTERLDARLAVQHCCQMEMLTLPEAEQITASLTNNGNSYANFKLLLILPKTKDWFPKFLKIAWALKCKELVKMLDSDAYDEMCTQDDEMEEITTSEKMCTQDDKMEEITTPEMGETEMIGLREYQKELAEDACQGRNVIICAPTGSGKTRVAIHIIANHLANRAGEKKKVIFLVNQRALADQQFQLCKKYFGERYNCFQVCGDTELSVPFTEIVHENDILVVTAQILVKALKPEELKTINTFSLLIFDECHHAKDSHPFNSIMMKYLCEKYPDQNFKQVCGNLPQIVGLTASVGVGKGKTQDSIVEHIRKLCANLDADKLCTVEKNSEELLQYTNNPEQDIVPCNARTVDEFKKIVDSIMRIIETKMRDLNDPEIGLEIPDLLSHTSPSYTQWISGMKREIAKLGTDPVHRNLEHARRHLKMYHDALTINEDCRTVDAMTFLQEETYDIKRKQGKKFNKFQSNLLELFDTHKFELQMANRSSDSANPKLSALHKMIKDVFDNGPDSRVIVFVKTRKLASALVCWMSQTPDLIDLKPRKMVGAAASSETGGMTQKEQTELLERFRDGVNKLIVATSVAQEGLDVTMCNSVIQYDHNTNEIAMVQSRGRARAKKSQYLVIAGESSSVQEKEELNRLREKEMNKAIIIVKGQIASDQGFYEQLKTQHQHSSLRNYLINCEMTKKSLSERDVQLLCLSCDNQCCFSSDIRTINGSHHIVVDPDFKFRIKVKKHRTPRQYDGIEEKGKLFCENCHDCWGNVVKYNGHFYPVIAIVNLRVLYSNGSRMVYKKWKQVNFPVKPHDPTEMIENLDGECTFLTDSCE